MFFYFFEYPLSLSLSLTLLVSFTVSFKLLCENIPKRLDIRQKLPVALKTNKRTNLANIYLFKVNPRNNIKNG